MQINSKCVVFLLSFDSPSIMNNLHGGLNPFHCPIIYRAILSKRAMFIEEQCYFHLPTKMEALSCYSARRGHINYCTSTHVIVRLIGFHSFGLQIMDSDQTEHNILYFQTCPSHAGSPISLHSEGCSRCLHISINPCNSVCLLPIPNRCQKGSVLIFPLQSNCLPHPSPCHDNLDKALILSWDLKLGFKLLTFRCKMPMY